MLILLLLSLLKTPREVGTKSVGVEDGHAAVTSSITWYGAVQICEPGSDGWLHLWYNS